MIGEYNIYCDESCHLENDKQRSMALGAVWCPRDNSKDIFQRIREIKEKHGLPSRFEIKWIKVSPGRVEFYLDIIDFFYDNDELSFRALVIPDKTLLNHRDFNQTHDEFYYKMYFQLLNVIFSPGYKYYIYLDIKDTKSNARIIYFLGQHLHSNTNMNDVKNKESMKLIKKLKPPLPTSRDERLRNSFNTWLMRYESYM